MDIQEIKEKKETLETDIAALIRKFNRETEITVSDIEITLLEMAYGEPALAGVKVKADL